MSQPAASICLPIFNAEKFLPASIESILGQSFNDFELLIADDGSTDGSPDLILNYAKQDSRIKYFRNEKNLGAVRNYNLCFKKSEGKYIKPFGADDIMHVDHLKAMIAAFEVNPQVALVSCARQIIDTDGNKGEVASSFPSSGMHDGAEIREESLRRVVYVFNLVGEPSCVLLRRESLPAEGFDRNYYHMTDLDMWLQVLRSGDLYYINAPLCYYRKHRDTTTTNNFRSLYYTLDFMRIIDRNIELAEKIYGSREAAYAAVAEHLGRFVNQLVEDGVVSLESISANLLDSKNPLHLQSGIAQAESARPITLNDTEYFRMIALFALYKCGENARRLDKTYKDLSQEVQCLREELEAVNDCRSMRLFKRVAGLFGAK